MLGSAQANDRLKTVVITLVAVGVLYTVFNASRNPQMPAGTGTGGKPLTTIATTPQPGALTDVSAKDAQDQCVLTQRQLLAGVTAGVAAARPKKVYIDLGANNGDSVYKFFDLPMGPGKPFADGDVLGHGRDGEWDVWAFEANPHFTKSQEELAERIRKHPRLTLRQYKICAAHTADGTVTFSMGNGLGGGSLDATAPDVQWGMKSKAEWKQSTVPALDIARVILENYRKEDHVFLKVDIEDTEYKLLRHLLLRGVMPLIDELAVEYHAFGPEKDHQRTMEWILNDSHIRIHDWK